MVFDSSKQRMPSAKKIRARSKKYYLEKRLNILSARKEDYVQNANKNKAYSKRSYSIVPDKKKAASRAYSKRSYSIAPERKKAYSKISYAKNHRAKSKYFKKYYAKHKESMRATRRDRYALAEPKPDVKELYLKAMQAHMLHDSEARSELTNAFKKQHAIVAKRVSRALGRTACRIAAKRLRNNALQMRKDQAGWVFAPKY